jgi:hypothetical protein
VPEAGASTAASCCMRSRAQSRSSARASSIAATPVAAPKHALRSARAAMRGDGRGCGTAGRGRGGAQLRWRASSAGGHRLAFLAPAARVAG